MYMQHILCCSFCHCKAWGVQSSHLDISMKKLNINGDDDGDDIDGDNDDYRTISGHSQ